MDLLCDKGGRSDLMHYMHWEEEIWTEQSLQSPESLGSGALYYDYLQRDGNPYVLAKAKDEPQGAILEKVGADANAYPEEIWERVAKA